MAGGKIGKNKIVPDGVTTSTPTIISTSVETTEKQSIDYNKGEQQVGHLNEYHEFIEYRGKETDTAKVNIDNHFRTISVDVKPTEVKISAIDGGNAFDS